MSTPLANPRRTRLVAWPSKQGAEEQKHEQATTTAADSSSTTATEQATAAR
ncbi:hypothetical protein GCM10009678_23320 [Actinomadura kijaniata]|uniref:Uncharacterized protein n=1 Tax=Actinomadura namibiensis TaxID=182080 RepID=A0A7W3LMX5_ACTNM|nr:MULTISPECIES: hypothetical protein [Actinomadura]MBA8951079.1 hypothetical protein [Actinomadura namibiensis]